MFLQSVKDLTDHSKHNKSNTSITINKIKLIRYRKSGIMLTINLFDIFRNILPFGVYKFTENLTKK
jgi:hypothetical protein